MLKKIAAADHNVKVIRNTRNFGHIRSPMHGLHQSTGDCIIGIVGDLQDPPEMIPEMVRHWENGYAMVICMKAASEENPLMFWIRKRYYRLVNRLSGMETFENFTGFGLYDRARGGPDRSPSPIPIPYFRGHDCRDRALPRMEISYDQPVRKRGITSNNFYTLYDIGHAGHHQPCPRCRCAWPYLWALPEPSPRPLRL